MVFIHPLTEAERRELTAENERAGRARLKQQLAANQLTANRHSGSLELPVAAVPRVVSDVTHDAARRLAA
jgi:hypothetical protein